MLVDESEEDETVADADDEGGHVRLSPEPEKLLKSLNEYNVEAEKATGEEGDNVENSSSSSSESEIDETEHLKRIRAEVEKEKQLKRKRREEKDDDLYITSPDHVQTEVQTPPSSGGRKKVKKVEKKVEKVLVENKKLVDSEKKLEKRVKAVEAENSSLLKRVEADQTDIDILKVRIAELEEEKARRDEQNEYFKLKNKELEAANAKKEHEMFMVNKVLENLIGKSVEQTFEEIQVEEVRARRQAAIEAEMKNKGKGVEGVSEVTERAIVPSTILESPIQNPRPISAVSGIFEEDVDVDDVVNVDEEEDDDESKKDDADDVFSASSDDDDDDDDDDGNDDDQGTSGIKVTEASNEENVDDYLHDDANEEPENAGSEGEHVDDQNVDESENLILRLELDVEEGEIRHTYTLDDIIKMTHIDESTFKFDFEEELNQFDINQQPDYQYKYVEEADNYDRVEVEDCSDEENVNVDTSDFPTLVEFFSQANIDELRRRVEECLEDKNFDGTLKDEQREERKKRFRKDIERKFKRPLKFYKRVRAVSLGDIISWGFLPQVNAYVIRREYGVQYFAYIQDIMSLTWWDVEELSKVRTLNYPIRKHDVPVWGLIKFKAYKEFKH
ncbi:FK506-binding protein 5-like [Helianthus annuus]|uniref:FK506-binding protein 5-like n=1 Tax=Helianthus annuus TaxID=4232 RepID=UPI000B8FB904|nr:FK506-binding protein 5-like [Helianthus annuus]